MRLPGASAPAVLAVAQPGAHRDPQLLVHFPSAESSIDPDLSWMIRMSGGRRVAPWLTAKQPASGFVPELPARAPPVPKLPPRLTCPPLLPPSLLTSVGPGEKPQPTSTSAKPPTRNADR